MTSIYAEKVSAKVRLIHVEQMSSYNFIILRKKTDSKTGVFLRNLWNFQEQWWLLWKQVTYYYVGHKLVIFNAVLFTLLHLLLTRWWDIRLKHDVVGLWEEQVDNRNVCLKQKEVLPTPYYIDKASCSWSFIHSNPYASNLFKCLILLY